MTPNASSLPARKRATSCSSERNRKRRTGCQPGRRSAAGALRAEASTNVLFSRTLTTRGGGSCASVLSNLHRTRTSRGHRRPNVAPGMRRIAVVEDSETLAEAVASTLRVAGLELEPDGRSASLSGRPVHLTPTEFALLHHLAERPRRAVSREHLLVEVWGYADGTGERTVDSHVAALRRKLGP